ncbi:MAG: phage tail protein, partial [Proteobacteria bacterium]|nr:phage tail protein [Pseudomonadota bacterium]
IVEIDDISQAGFQKCSELSVEIANVQYFECGALEPGATHLPRRHPRARRHPGPRLFGWFSEVAITSSGLGLNDPNYKRNLDFVQQDRNGTTLRRWSLTGAWPVKFVAGEWDSESDENIIESVRLVFDYFELTQ